MLLPARRFSSASHYVASSWVGQYFTVAPTRCIISVAYLSVSPHPPHSALRIQEAQQQRVARLPIQVPLPESGVAAISRRQGQGRALGTDRIGWESVPSVEVCRALSAPTVCRQQTEDQREPGQHLIEAACLSHNSKWPTRLTANQVRNTNGLVRYPTDCATALFARARL